MSKIRSERERVEEWKRKRGRERMEEKEGREKMRRDRGDRKKEEREEESKNRGSGDSIS
jgi:hypothetical protein